jgi:hypothetical protein
MPSLCVICVKPHPVWVDFLLTCTHYDVYLVIDSP